MSDQPANNQLPSIKLVVYSSLFLIIAIIVGMTFARIIAISQSKDIANNKSAEYIPIKIDSGERELKGKILPNFDTSVKATHRLLDENSKLIAFITANNDILKVSEGFNVTVIGKLEGTAKDHIEVIRVEKIKLK